MNSSLVKHEYFELVKKLNKTNKLKNQTTELYFFIDSTNSKSFKLYAAISASQIILLCEKLHSSIWKAAAFSEFPHLESHIAQLLRISDNQSNLTSYIKSHIF